MAFSVIVKELHEVFTLSKDRVNAKCNSQVLYYFKIGIFCSVVLFTAYATAADNFQVLKSEEVKKILVELECIQKHNVPFAWFSRKKYLIKKGMYISNSFSSTSGLGELSTGWQTISRVRQLSETIKTTTGNKIRSYTLSFYYTKSKKNDFLNHNFVRIYLTDSGFTKIEEQRAHNVFSEENDTYEFSSASVDEINTISEPDWVCSNNVFNAYNK